MWLTLHRTLLIIFCDAMEECKEDDSRMMAVAFEEVQPGEIKGLPVLKK